MLVYTWTLVQVSTSLIICMCANWLPGYTEATILGKMIALMLKTFLCDRLHPSSFPAIESKTSWLHHTTLRHFHENLMWLLYQSSILPNEYLLFLPINQNTSTFSLPCPQTPPVLMINNIFQKLKFSMLYLLFSMKNTFSTNKQMLSSCDILNFKKVSSFLPH